MNHCCSFETPSVRKPHIPLWSVAFALLTISCASPGQSGSRSTAASRASSDDADEDQLMHGGQIEGVPPETQQRIHWIEYRARQLFHSERAAIVATDLLFTTHVDRTRTGIFFAESTGADWHVYFGKLTDDLETFDIGYAFRCDGAENCVPIAPQAGSGSTTTFARAIHTAMPVVKPQVPSYNVNVFREDNGTITVYFTPGNTNPGVALLGGDYRVSVSSDGMYILDQKQLHLSIIEMALSPPKGENAIATMHTHITDDLPSETDVSLILMNPSLAPHFAVTREWLCRIDSNGRITIVGHNQ